MKKFSTRFIITGAFVGTGLTVGFAQSEMREIPPPNGEQVRIYGQRQIDRVLQQWEEGPAEKAREMIEQHGPPDEITRKRLIWEDAGPWKRTEIVNESIPHNFPKPHHDFLYQTVDYNVPEDKVEDVIRMSGSILIDRVKGEVTARCDDESANFLTMNLVHQIVEGKKNAKSGRDTYAETMLDKKHQDLTERLVFHAPSMEDPSDPGIAYGGREEDVEGIGSDQDAQQQQEKKQEQQAQGQRENRRMEEKRRGERPEYRRQQQQRKRWGQQPDQE